MNNKNFVDSGFQINCEYPFQKFENLYHHFNLARYTSGKKFSIEPNFRYYKRNHQKPLPIYEELLVVIHSILVFAINEFMKDESPHTTEMSRGKRWRGDTTSRRDLFIKAQISMVTDYHYESLTISFLIYLTD